MAASRLCSAAAIAAAFTSMSMTENRAYAESRFHFPFFSSSPPSDSPTDHSSSNSKPESDEPKGSGFDPESLERGAKALREINSSPHSKQVFDLMRKQEKTRLAELAADKMQNEAIQAHNDIERQRKLAEDQSNLVQQQAQAKGQMLRYEDELARKRQQLRDSIMLNWLRCKSSLLSGKRKQESPQKNRFKHSSARLKKRES